MSFCTQGMPGVVESTVSKSQGKPSLWEGGARVMADEGWQKRNLPYPSLTYPRPSPTVCDGPHVQEGEGYCQE